MTDRQTNQQTDTRLIQSYTYTVCYSNVRFEALNIHITAPIGALIPYKSDRGGFLYDDVRNREEGNIYVCSALKCWIIRGMQDTVSSPMYMSINGGFALPWKFVLWNIYWGPMPVLYFMKVYYSIKCWFSRGLKSFPSLVICSFKISYKQEFSKKSRSQHYVFLNNFEAVMKRLAVGQSNL